MPPTVWLITILLPGIRGNSGITVAKQIGFDAPFNKQGDDSMSAVQMRPTFLLETPLPTAELMRRIRDRVANSADDYHGQFTSNHVMISLTPSKRHFWSPWMNLEVRDADQVRQIFGRFSPHPSIWTAFMFSYLSIAVIIFFALMFGISQQLSGQSPWAYFTIPLGVLLAAVLWFASKAGQKLAQVEMQQLRGMLETCLTNE